MDSQRINDFTSTVLGYYFKHGRHDLPWRVPNENGALDPYKILVSELMLQQTQVLRVVPKYLDFLDRFPTTAVLARAPLAEVLKAWSGLGYNRRAKFLWQAAQVLVAEYGANVPHTMRQLVTLPGVGPNTAGAILAYAYNRPVVFIETNIRTVLIYHFFAGEQQVDDKKLLDIAAQVLPDNPRQWYWALMDYGTHLKETVGNLNKLSKSYTKQSAFIGSRRQVRGKVLRLLNESSVSFEVLAQTIPDERLGTVLADLQAEGLIAKSGNNYALFGG